MAATLLALALGFAVVPPAHAASIDFVGLGSLQFAGSTDSFRFLNQPPPANSDTDHTGSTRDFVITVAGAFSSLVGLLGNITGTFTIGAITTSGPIQSAPVTGAGAFSINDGAGQNFLATLAWDNIQTVTGGGPVSFGAVNATGTVNLSNFSYAGTNTDLLALATFPGAIVTATFSFAPPRNLAALTATGQVNTTGYAGTLTPVPEPITMFLGGTGLISLGYVARRRLFRK
jgi:hypothetical protein